MAITLSPEDFAEIERIVRTALMTAPAPQVRPAQAAGGGAVFPNYGRNKNEPVAGAEVAQLEYYREGAKKSLADPSKARWHDRDLALKNAIEAEMRRQGAAVPDDHQGAAPITGGGANGGGFESDDVPFLRMECSADRI